MDFERVSSHPEQEQENKISAEDVEAIMDLFPESLRESMEEEWEDIDLDNKKEVQDFYNKIKNKWEKRKDFLNQKFTGYKQEEKYFLDNLSPELRERTIEEVKRLSEKIRSEEYQERGYGQVAKIKASEKDAHVCYKYITNEELYKLENNIGKEMHIQTQYREAAEEMEENRCKIPYPIYYNMDNYSHFCMMENIQGCNIQELLGEQGKLPQEFDPEEFFAHLQEFIEQMNKKGMYHRDLHKGNIMVEYGSGSPVVIDFGKSLDSAKEGYVEDPYMNGRYIPDQQGVNSIKSEVLNFIKNKQGG